MTKGCTAGRYLASKTEFAGFDSLGARHFMEDMRAGCSSRIANPRGLRAGGFEPLVFRHHGHRVGPRGPATLKTSRFQFDSGGVHHSSSRGQVGKSLPRQGAVLETSSLAAGEALVRIQPCGTFHERRRVRRRSFLDDAEYGAVTRTRSRDQDKFWQCCRRRCPVLVSNTSGLLEGSVG